MQTPIRAGRTGAARNEVAVTDAERIQRLERAIRTIVINLNRVVKVSDPDGEAGALASVIADVEATLAEVKS